MTYSLTIIPIRALSSLKATTELVTGLVLVDIVSVTY